METGYQRGKIQEEASTTRCSSTRASTRSSASTRSAIRTATWCRSSSCCSARPRKKKESQLTRLADFHARHAAKAPAMLKRLQDTVIANGNVFAVLMDAVRVCSLGQITDALFEVGGQYRRNM
jgi:methylmalonyl-CoA mutase